MTLPASRYYTANDLAWFSLDRYASLSKFSFTQWRDLVRDRLHAHQVVDAVIAKSSGLITSSLQQHWGLSTDQLIEGDSDLLRGLVTRIKDSPLDQLDALVTLTGTERLAATSTVRLMTGSYLQSLYWRARNADILGSEMEVDGALLVKKPQLKSIERQPTIAHVVLNMDATDKQITEDFKLWLAEWRRLVGGKFKNESYSKACREWCERKIVPYFDLKLLSKIEQKVINDEDLVKLLDLEDNETKRQKALRNLSRWQKELFCEETATMLTHLSFSDARSQLQKDST